MAEEQVETTGTPEVEAPTGTLEQPVETTATEIPTEGGPERETGAPDYAAEAAALRQQLLEQKIAGEERNKKLREREEEIERLRQQTEPAFDALGALEELDRRLAPQPVQQAPSYQSAPQFPPSYGESGEMPSDSQLLMWQVLAEQKQIKEILAINEKKNARQIELSRLSTDKNFNVREAVKLVARKAQAGERISLTTAHEILSGASNRSREAAEAKLREEQARSDERNRRTSPTSVVRPGAAPSGVAAFIPLATVEQMGLAWYEQKLKEGYREVDGGIAKR